MTTVEVVGVGCATAVKVVRWRLEACAMQQAMTTQTTMGMMIKSILDATVDPTIIPAIEREIKIDKIVIEVLMECVLKL